MATTKKAKRGGDGRKYFPFVLPTELYGRAQRRADEIFAVPTYFFNSCLRDLAEGRISEARAERAREIASGRAAAGQAPEKSQWNFQLKDETVRDRAHAVARALGFNVSAYLITCAEDLADAETPSYVAAHQGEAFVKEATSAVRSAARAGGSTKGAAKRRAGKGSKARAEA